MFKKNKKALVFADALVEFSNLEDSGVEAFRAAHPNFAPAAWWDYKVGTGDEEPRVAWKLVQADLRRMWDVWVTGERLSFRPVAQLCLAVFDPNDTFIEGKRFADPTTEMSDTKWDFHKAVFFINSDPSWRVKVCKCGRRYVADHPRRRYCSDWMTCPAFAKVMQKRIVAERKKKLNWWNRNRAKKAKRQK